MGPPATIRIKNAVAVDDLVIFVLEQRKIQLTGGEPLLQLLDKLLRKLMAVNADCQNLDLSLLFLGQKALQLPELLCAVRSPMAAVKDKNYVLLSPKIRQGNLLPIHILKGKVGGCIPYFDPVEVLRRQLVTVLRS